MKKHLLLSLIILGCLWSDLYSQPMNLQVRVRRVNVTYSGTDAALLATPDEFTFKFWARDNLTTNWGPLGGNCLTDEYNPPGLSQDFNELILNENYPGGAANPTFFDVRIDAWEDEADDPTCNTTRCDFNGNVCCGLIAFGACVGITTSDDNRCNLAPFLDDFDHFIGPPCEWYNHGLSSGGGCNDYQAEIESFWRYNSGTGCNDAIDLGVMNAGFFNQHLNSNVCYSNNNPSSAGNDVYYSFTITEPRGIRASLCGSAAFDTYLYLLDPSCNVINFNDDACNVQSEIITSLCTPGTYYLIVDATLPSEQGTFTLTLADEDAALVKADAGPDQVFCLGSSVTLGGSPTAQDGSIPYAYSWIPTAGLNNPNIANPVASPTVNTNYILAVTDGYGCTIYDTVSITVSNPPTASFVASSTQFCGGDTVLLTSSSTGAVSFAWELNGGPAPGIPNLSTYNATVGGDYTLIATNAQGCSDTSAITTITELPAANAFATAGGPTTFCMGDSVLIMATGNGDTYQWLDGGSPISGATDSLYMAGASGSYQVVMTFGGNCPDTSAAVVVVVNPVPTAGITLNGLSTICSGDSTQLSATGGNTYQWLINGGPISGATGATYQATITGGYSVVAINTFGCGDTSVSLPINVITSPSAAIFTSDPVTFCDGDTANLLVTGFGDAYQWMVNGINIPGATDSVFAATTSGDYQAILSIAGSCSDTSSILTITANPLPAATISPSTTQDICAGDSVAFTAGGGNSYQWYMNGVAISGATNANYTTTQAGVYYADVISVDNCMSATATVTVNVNAVPTANIFAGGTTALCQGDSVVLSASGGSTYQWLDGGSAISGATSNSYTATTAGDYSVVAISGAGCPDTSAVISVTVNPTPVAGISASGSTTFCQGDSVTLNATGGVAYQWMLNGSAITGITGSTVVANFSGDFSVIAYDGLGCADTSAAITITVDVQPMASIQVLGATAICAGDSVGMIASGGVSYQWLNGGSPIAGATGTTYYATVSGDYSVEVRNALGGCPDTSSIITITINPNPTASISALGATTFCAGDSVTLQGSGGLGYQWMENGSVLVGATNSTLTVGAAGSYAVIVSNGFGCLDTSSIITTTVDPQPTATITAVSPTAICAGDSVTLVAGGGGQYQWLDGGVAIVGATTSVYHALGSGDYSVEVRNNLGGCPDTSTTITVTINPNPTAGISALGSTTFCAGDSVTLQASGGTTYQWMGNGSAITGATANTLTVGAAGNYSVIATNGNGCSDTSSVISTTIDPQPTATISAATPTAICAGDSVTLVAGGGGQYQWLDGGVAIAGATSSVYYALGSGDYSVEVRNNIGGCPDTSATLTVTINPNPTAGISALGSTTFCAGDSVTLQASGGTTYQWIGNGSMITGATSSTLTVGSAGSYSVIATNGNGCSDTSIVINTTIDPQPTATISAVTPTAICAGDSVTLIAGGGSQYQWLDGGVAIAGATNSVYYALGAGDYSVEVRNGLGGCPDTSSIITVTVNPNPTAGIAPLSLTTFCTGDSTTLQGSGGLSYQWLENGFAIPGATDSTITLGTSGQYAVVAINGFGCTDTSTFIGTLAEPQPIATAVATGSTTFCDGSSVILVASGGGVYQWLDGGIAIGGATSNIYEATDSGDYSVIVRNTNLSCPDTSAAINVIANPNPVANIALSGPATFCDGDSVVLSTSGGTTYQWYQDGIAVTAGADSFLVVQTGGNYNVIVGNAQTCADTSANVTITVDPQPVASVTTLGATTFCNGDSVGLVASGGASYQWLNGGVSIAGATTNIYYATTTGDYSVEVRNALGGCADTSAVTSVVVNPNPTAAISFVGSIPFCDGDSLVLESGGGASYQWFENGIPIIGATDSTYAVYNAGVYTVEVASGNGCSDLSGGLGITVDPQPIADISINTATSICVGDSSLFTEISGTGASYEWLQNGVPASGNNTLSSYTAGTSGDYSVVLLNAIGTCPDTSAAISLTVNPQPTATISASGATTLCAGDTVVLTGSGGTSYQWIENGNTLASPLSPSFIATGTGVYSVIATDANGCADTSSVISVTVNPQPTASVTTVGTTAICPGDTTTLVASGGTFYQWLDAGAIIAGATSPVFQATTGGDYSVEVRNNINTCPDTSSVVSITLNPAPTAGIALNGTVPFCEGDSVELLASGGDTYQWQSAGSAIIGATGASLTVLTAGNYSVVAISADGCADTSTVEVVTTEVQPTATAFAATPTSICPGDTVLLVGNGGGLYQWSVNGSPIAGANNSTYQATDAGSYTVEVTNANGNCPSVSAAITVGLNPVPIGGISAPGGLMICDGDSTILQAGGGLSYQWLLNGTAISGATSSTYTATTAGDYAAVAINGTTCRDTTNALTVVVNPTPVAGLVLGGPSTFCLGQNSVLIASGGDTYQWMANGGTLGAPTTDNIREIQGAGTYQVIAIHALGCTDTSSAITISVNQNPMAGLNPSGIVPICENEGGTALFASGGGTYEWLFNNEPLGTGADVILADSLGNYSVVAISADGCRDTSSVASTVISELPNAEMLPMGTTNVCIGDSVTFLAMGGDSYVWLSGADTVGFGQVLTVGQSGPYTAVAINTCGADTSGFIVVQVNNNPSPNFVYDPLEPIIDRPVQFFDQSLSGVTWAWDFGNGQTSSEQNPITSFGSRDTFLISLTVTDDIGCDSTVVVPIFVEGFEDVFIPNVFTPNGDGLYDVFEIFYDDLTEIQVDIFDRWGNKVFNTTSPTVFWDGKNGAQNAPEGVYYYSVQGRRGVNGSRTVLKGHVTLLR